MVLTDNIIDQNHFGNIIRQHYLTLETVSAQSEMNEKNQYQCYSSG